MPNTHLKKIMKCLESEGLKYYLDPSSEEEDEEVIVPLCFKKIPAIIFRIMASDNGKVSLTAKIGTAENEEDRQGLYPILNDLNSKYSFASIYICDSGSIFCDIQFIMDKIVSNKTLSDYIDAMISIGKEAASPVCRFLNRETDITIEDDTEIDESDYYTDDFIIEDLGNMFPSEEVEETEKPEEIHEEPEFNMFDDIFMEVNSEEELDELIEEFEDDDSDDSSDEGAA